MPRSRLEPCEILRLQPCGTDDVDDARLRREPRKCDRGGGRGEIEHAISVGKDRQGIVGHVDVEQADAGQKSRVVLKRVRAAPFDRADKAAALGFGDRPDEITSHAPCGTDDDETHLAHGADLLILTVESDAVRHQPS